MIYTQLPPLSIFNINIVFQHRNIEYYNLKKIWKVYNSHPFVKYS